MPCEVVLLNEESINNALTPKKQRAGLFKRGEPVEVKDIPHVGWGQRVIFPKYNFLIITDATAAQVQSKINTYQMNIDWEVIDNTLQFDEWTLNIYATNPDISGYCKLDLSLIQTIFNAFNISVDSATRNSIIITSTIENILKSTGFWKLETITGITFTDGYNYPINEMHNIIINYTNYLTEKVNRERVGEYLRSIIVDREASNIIHNIAQQEITFNITRTEVLNYLKTSIKRKETIIWKRKFYLNDTTMDQLETYYINNSQPYEVTLATAQTYFLDKELE
jgi:hypothetical protein